MFATSAKSRYSGDENDEVIANGAWRNCSGPLGFAPSPQWRHLPPCTFLKLGLRIKVLFEARGRLLE